MKKLATLMLLISLCTGCATTLKTTGEVPPQPNPESRRLASALTKLEKGENSGAARELEAICAANPVPGVTDEALFRLALLSLKPTTDRPASVQGHLLLKRLKKDYPSSPWTAQALPLSELISVAEELRRQNRNYKSANQSLTREINELNRSIGQLKHLDLELEKKTR